MLLLLTACASSSSGTSQPTTCKRTDRSGTYRIVYTTVSGNCGDIPQTNVDFNTIDPTCKVVSDRWSENDCKLERTLECALPNSSQKIVAVTRQTAEDGSKVSGSFTISATSKDGKTSCDGTYDATASRL